MIEQQLAEGQRADTATSTSRSATRNQPSTTSSSRGGCGRLLRQGFLWADANTGYSPERPSRSRPKLRAAGVDVLESPLPPTQIRGYQALKQQGALPILMDEGSSDPMSPPSSSRSGLMDGMALKPARNAGLWPSVQIVNQLRAHGLMVLGSGLTDPDFSLAAATHLYAWAGLSRPCALNGPQFLADSLTGRRSCPSRTCSSSPRVRASASRQIPAPRVAWRWSRRADGKMAFVGRDRCSRLEPARR